MNIDKKFFKNRIHKHINIQIISRNIPVENTIGNATYILDFIRYLRRSGCQIEYILLNSSPNGKTPWYVIPPSLAALTKVSARDNIRIGRILLRFNSLLEWLIAPLHLTYNVLLPETLKNLYRSARDERQKMRAHVNAPQLWDTLATTEEVAFTNARFLKFKADVVIINYAWLSGVLDAIPSNEPVLKVILTHDILHKRIASFRNMGVEPGHSDWNWNKESAQLCKAQVLLAIQEEEAKTFKEMAPSAEVICMPMSIVCHTHKTRQVRGRCLFVGSSSPHNTHGLQWFLENVWPIILQTNPYSSLHICGAVCEYIQGNFPSVCLLGRVTDLNLEYSAAEVCLVPLLVGSGLKIKLVEALSHGRACVSTSVGVQGLQKIVDHAVLVGDTAEDFAAAVETVLNHPEKRQSMEEQARKYVTEKLSPQAVYQPFVDRIEQHLQQVANKTTQQLLDNKLSTGRILTSNLMPNKEKSHEI